MPTVVPTPIPLATTDDVATELLRTLTPPEAAAAASWIAQLSALIRTRRPQIDAWVNGALISSDVVTGVITRAVVRRLRNPDGKVQESIDDYSYRRADAVAAGDLYLSDDDWAVLVPPAQVAQRTRSVALRAYGGDCW